MINVSLSVREALLLTTKCDEYGGDEGRNLRDRIILAMEKAMGVDHRYSVTITNGMTMDNRIPCIKTVRKYTGWGLKESKEWTDVIIGCRSNSGGDQNTVHLNSNEAAESLLRELTSLGCEGYLC